MLMNIKYLQEINELNHEIILFYCVLFITRAHAGAFDYIMMKVM